MPHASPPLYANPSSTHHQRGYFATRHLFATPFEERERYPAGNYPLEPNPQGIREWTSAVSAPPPPPPPPARVACKSLPSCGRGISDSNLLDFGNEIPLVPAERPFLSTCAPMRVRFCQSNNQSLVEGQ